MLFQFFQVFLYNLDIVYFILLNFYYVYMIDIQKLYDIGNIFGENCCYFNKDEKNSNDEREIEGEDDDRSGDEVFIFYLIKEGMVL